MGLNLETVSALLNSLRQQRELLRRPQQMSWSEFAADIERQYVAKHALLLAIQACLDLCAHIITASGAEVPASYADLPCSLARLGILPNDLAERLAQAAGLRNRLVHNSTMLN
jgi:uncharacterized protein YutE (UPF0331/DUF86 family)